VSASPRLHAPQPRARRAGGSGTAQLCLRPRSRPGPPHHLAATAPRARRSRPRIARRARGRQRPKGTARLSLACAPRGRPSVSPRPAQTEPRWLRLEPPKPPEAIRTGWQRCTVADMTELGSLKQLG
jgi:hypothetical protein